MTIDEGQRPFADERNQLDQCHCRSEPRQEQRWSLVTLVKPEIPQVTEVFDVVGGRGGQWHDQPETLQPRPPQLPRAEPQAEREDERVDRNEPDDVAIERLAHDRAHAAAGSCATAVRRASSTSDQGTLSLAAATPEAGGERSIPDRPWSSAGPPTRRHSRSRSVPAAAVAGARRIVDRSSRRSLPRA